MISARTLRFALACAILLLPSLDSFADSLGPASKRTALVISEVMYHPASRSDGKDLEYIEIYNSDSVAKNLSGFQIKGDVEYSFPNGTVLPGLGFMVVASRPDDLKSVYGLTTVHGPFVNLEKLPNSSGRIELWSKSGALLLEIDYSDEKPWPAAADGSGHSLVLARPTFGQNNPQAWTASARIGGSPGALDPVVNDIYTPLLLNEVLAHTDDPVEDYIEIYNHSNASISLAGCILSDDPERINLRSAMFRFLRRDLFPSPKASLVFRSARRVRRFI